MAKPGDVLEHPITGERISFLETSEQTGGAYTRLRLEVGAGGIVIAPHIHPRLDERYEIISGDWEIALGGVERRLGPGECLLIPAGAIHSCRTAGGEEAATVIELSPSLTAEAFLESWFGLGQDGLGDPSTGIPPQPWLALLLTEYGPDVAHPAEPPLSELLAAMAPIAAEAKRQGLRLPYPYPYPRLATATGAGTRSYAG